MPHDYADWLVELKTRIHTAQQRAALAVNRELVLLYWHCLLYTSDAADDLLCVDLGGRRTIKKKI